jgi:DNA polymerase-3 subunit delta
MLPVVEPPAVTLVLGPESFLAERAVAGVVAAARAADPGADLRAVPASSLTRGSVEELASPSLFTASTVVVVERADELVDEVATALVEAVLAGPGTTLVVVHPGGVRGKRALDIVRAAAGTVVRCDRLTRGDDLAAFAREEARAHGGTLAQDAAARLVDAVGTDLRALAAACAQLVADAPRGRVDEALVETYFEGRAEVRGWAIADRAMEGRADQALVTLRWALATGTDAVVVVGALATSLRTLARLGGLPRPLREADVARELEVPSWKVRVLREQLRGWDQAGLAHAIDRVAAADLAVKGAGSDPTLALSRAVLEVCEARRG